MGILLADRNSSGVCSFKPDHLLVLYSVMDMGFETSKFNQAVSGEKDVEGRLRWKKFSDVKAGDVIDLREDMYDEEGNELSTVARHVSVFVQEVVDYDSFQAMFEEIDFRRAIPEARTAEEAVAAYHQFYTPEQEKEHGTRAIIFKVIQPAAPDV